MPDEPPYFEITAHIDVAPREHAKTDFSQRATSDRSLRAKLHYLHADGYSTTVQLPSGTVLPGHRFPGHELMDAHMGYGPKPEHEHLMHLVEGTWVLLAGEPNDPS